jgi:formylmethanofuran dehydrogenase subunit B
MTPDRSPTAAAREASLVEDVVCLGCGCTCDDIALAIEGERIVEARRACALGAAWFGDGQAPARARIAGRDCLQEEALAEIARALHGARAPLIYLAPDITCEAQREGVALADLLHGTLDVASSEGGLASVLAAQTRGRATATLGEVRNRADLVVFWGVDPAERHPRFQERYAPVPPGVHVPDGRRSRTVVAVDVGDRRGPSDADLRLSVMRADEVAALVQLTAALASATAAAAPTPGTLSELGSRIRGARYAVIVADTDRAVSAPTGDARAEALVLLSLALNDVTRGALISLRPGGNLPGAEAVATSQTGFPMAIDFRRGYPRYRPWSGTASQLLARQDVDVVLVIGALDRLPDAMRPLLARATTCVIGPRASVGALSTDAAGIVDTGVPSVHEAGTVLRMDDVPLPVRGRISGPPSTQAITRALRERIVAMQDDAHRETPVRASS